MNFGHYNRDTSTAVSERLVQGNLQMYEQMWHRWVVEMGLHDLNESSTQPDGNKYRTNFNWLMTWDDGGGGGAYSSSDSNGFFYAMSNASNCRFDPPSGATPHEMGHVWEGTGAGFNGSNSSGAWWECTANWMLLQFNNTYPQAGGYLYNSVFYPAHGRDYYDSWVIWEAAREDARYGPQWVNEVWTNATQSQRVNEYIIDRMIRLDSSGSADKAGAIKDLWGDMAKKMVTWDFERQRWLKQANTPWNGDTWEWYTRCRAPMVAMPGNPGWFRPAREYLPQQFGFHFVPLSAAAGTTVSCDFEPISDFTRQSDWRACLVAVNGAGEASYSELWNKGTNSINLSADQAELYLMVMAVPKPMKILDPAWKEYTRDSGLQFPYTVSFQNAAPTNVTYPARSHSGMHQHPNGLGWISNSATVDATAYVGPNAQVLDSAQVKDNARIEEYAVVRNRARVSGNAVISGHAMVYENANVHGNAKVRDWAMIFGYAELYGNARAIEHAGCGSGDSDSHNKVYGDVVMKGVTSVYSPSDFSGSLITDGDTANGGIGDRGVHFGWQWGQNTSIFPSLTNNNYQYCGLIFEKDDPTFARDEFGINHGYMMRGCRTEKDSGGSVRGGRVLGLNGVDQYVELHNSVVDFKDSTFAVWFKRTGSAADQRVWSLGNGTGKEMYLTANAAGSGSLRFVISDGVTTRTLDGPIIPTNVWKHAAVVFSASTCSLYLDGTLVVSDSSMSLLPDALNAPLMENVNYLGRGNAGASFHGMIDDFRSYMRGLSASEITALASTSSPAPVTIAADSTPPAPNSASWLVAPMAIGDSTATMSATPGTDASNWIEYYFTCVSGGGHDSGWVSFNKYTDVGITPISTPSYSVKMRDRVGNTTGSSSVETATLASASAITGAFATPPAGIADGQIRMSAVTASSPSGKVEYKFDRILPSPTTSGWRSSPTWTQSGLTAGNSYSYTVMVRDGRGNIGNPSAAASALARDDTGPALPVPVAHWEMLPYATIDNKISMTATPASDPGGVEYRFTCTAGGGPDSGWQSSKTFLTPNALPDGSYTYQYQVRDKSSRKNESQLSTTFIATITPTSGYHDASFAQIASLPDDSLVTFNGVVTRVQSDHYVVKDVASLATVEVRSDQYALATDTAKELKLCKISGHLWTFGGTRVVTYASVVPIMDPPAFTVSGKVSGNGSGIGGATVYFSITPGALANPLLTATTDAGGNYTKALPNGQWHVVALAPDRFPATERSLVVNGWPVAGLNFNLTSAITLTSTAGPGGTITPAGAVLLSDGDSQTFTISPDGGKSIGSVWIDGINHGSIASYTFPAVAANHTISANFTTNTPKLPQVPLTGNLIESAISDTHPASGTITSWPSYFPAGRNYTKIGSPEAVSAEGAKWDLNLRSQGDGFDCGNYGSTAIPCNGASIVVAVKPIRITTSDSWNSIVDVFYNRFVLGIFNNTGKLTVWRNGVKFDTNQAIPDGQLSVLSLVCQPDGTFKIYRNGSQIYSTNSTSAMTSLIPGVPGAYATHINVGRNNPDDWTTFNGHMGDFFLYDVALGDAERQALEVDIIARFSSSTEHIITTSAGLGGTINPSGAVSVADGGGATFVPRPEIGYAVSQILVDGSPVGPLTSYTFENVTANHTISVSFTSVPTHTITTNSGTHGTISPTGPLILNAGSERTFTAVADEGYQVADLLVDGISMGAAASHTFTNIQASHSISASFGAKEYLISSSAGVGGSITPAGSVNVPFGTDRTYTISAAPGYSVSGIIVDGVDVGARGSYTFNSVVGPHTISAEFIAGSREIPAAGQLFFSADSDAITGSGNVSTWPWLWPAGNTLTKIATPRVTTIAGAKWEENSRDDGDGFRVGQYSAPISVTGGTIVCAIRPTRSTSSDPWNSVVDVMYGEMVLGMNNLTGIPVLRLKKSQFNGNTAIPEGQATVLTLVVQPGGGFVVYANGEIAMSGSGPEMTEWKPGNTTGNPNSYDNVICVGRNGPDGWTAFNGNIGDVFLYQTALTDTQRLRLEANVMGKFGIGGGTGGGGGDYTITASAGVHGSITPAGEIPVDSGADQAFSITPASGYQVANVWIDDIAVGVAGSYTFSETLANHSIHAEFATVPGGALGGWRNQHFTESEIVSGLADDDEDPDHDGMTNLAEFAFNGDPRDGASRGLSYVSTASGGKLSYICAVRRGAQFPTAGNNTRVSPAIDGVVYSVTASPAMTGAWEAATVDAGASDSPPAGSGLPDLTGNDWEYHTFTAFEGLPGRGFIRAGVRTP